MRIYVNSVSTSSRPVLLFLAEHDIPAEIIPISLRGGELLANFASVLVRPDGHLAHVRPVEGARNAEKASEIAA